MGEYRSVFDIIGPIMVGPSSSHTAGAVRIGKIARRIFGETPEEVEFRLFESFAKTHKGHGTDIALTGGMLNMEPDDIRLANAFMIAKEEGLQVSFETAEDKAEHPNTVQMTMRKAKRKLKVIGASIGGGAIEITEIDGFKVKLNSAMPTYLVRHNDMPGAILKVAKVFADCAVNVATMYVTRREKGGLALMIVEVDSAIRQEEIMAEIKKVDLVSEVSFFTV